MFSQNGCRRPFWMTENHFCSHFSPFLINTQLLLFSQNCGQRPFWIFLIDAKNHKFLVIWDLNGYGEYEFDWCICDKVMACKALACGSGDSGHGGDGDGGTSKNIIPPREYNYVCYFFFIFLNFFLQNDRPPALILDVWNSLWITFLAISDQYTNFNYFLEIFDKMAAVGYFGCPKFTFDRISGHFRSIRNYYFFGIFWQNGCRRPFWMSEIHFRSHFWPF